MRTPRRYRDVPVPHQASRLGRAFAGSLVLAAAVALAQPAASGAAVPGETQGQIDGKAARYFAEGDNVLLSTAEADRLGLSYREGRHIVIGSTTLWLVTLGSVTINGKAYLNAPAGVVTSVPEYFAALKAHRVEAMARSHQVEVQISGTTVRVYDIGSGLLLPVHEADRIGLRYRDGKAADVGAVAAWYLELAVTVEGKEVRAPVIVAEPQAYFDALQTQVDKGR